MDLLLVPAIVVVLVALLIYRYGVDSRLDDRGSPTSRPL
jgi:hypothetical protein